MPALTTENPLLAQLAAQNMEAYDEDGWLTVNFGSSEFSIPYREFSPGVKFLYRNGYCAFLALALHEITDLPLAVFTIPGTGLDNWLGHVALCTGPDEYLDVTGFSTAAEINEAYGYGENTPYGALALTITKDVSSVPEIFHEEVRDAPWTMLGELERLVTMDYAEQLLSDFLPE